MTYWLPPQQHESWKLNENARFGRQISDRKAVQHNLILTNHWSCCTSSATGTSNITHTTTSTRNCTSNSNATASGASTNTSTTATSSSSACRCREYSS